MGLSSSLNIGATALGASQLAIQVTGNNLANAATPGYSRQLASLASLRPDNYGNISVGTGVKVADVRRQVDDALQQRLWKAISDQASADQSNGSLGQIESMLDELGDRSLSNQLNTFFGAWSERANLTDSSAVVVQQGQALADFIRKMRSDIVKQGDNGDQQLGAMVDKSNDLLKQIAGLNQQISDFEAGGAEASTLRDQRDQLVTQLSQYMEVTSVEQKNGSVDVLVGSTPVVMGSVSRGVQLERQSRGTPPNTTLDVYIATRDDASRLNVQNGQIGAIISGRSDTVGKLVDTLDKVSQQIIFEVNKLHSTGGTSTGLTSLTSTLSIPTEDQARALNDPANTTLSNLPWQAQNGGFLVNVTSPTGAKTSVRINVDLDGRKNDGSVGFTDDTSLQSIVSQLNGVNGLSASVTADGHLKIDAASGFTFGFSDDSSNALAVLGVNTFFTGTTGKDIAVRQTLQDDPTQLATGRMTNGTFDENGTALAIAQLPDSPIAALGGRSIQQLWTDQVQSVGLQSSAAKSASDAAKVVTDSLQAQRDAVSAVSVDEESINLINYQRVYQGAAHFINVVNQLTDALLQIV
jgi:flagellar hook-associated protein 1 FlgK